MAITKVMGIETEYGITAPGAPDSNPVLASSLLVNAFSGRVRTLSWDYEDESPASCARGSPDARPVLADSVLHNAFTGRGLKVRWDYEEESPLRDARGFEAAREPETPAEDDLGLANVILTNRARYY